MYNRCTGIYKFGNNTYPRHVRRRSNLGHIFRGGKCVSYGPGNMVFVSVLFFYSYIYLFVVNSRRVAFISVCKYLHIYILCPV